MHTVVFFSNHFGLEKDFRASESLVSDSDSSSIREIIDLVVLAGFIIALHFSLEVKGNIGELLLKISDNFSFSRGGEIVSNFRKDLNHVLGKVSSGEVYSHNSVGKGVSFIDGDRVGNTITRVNNDTGGSS